MAATLAIPTPMPHRPATAWSGRRPGRRASRWRTDPLGATMRLDLELRVPAALAASRARRSPLTVALPITVTVRLTHGLPRVDVEFGGEHRPGPPAARGPGRAADHRPRPRRGGLRDHPPPPGPASRRRGAGPSSPRPRPHSRALSPCMARPSAARAGPGGPEVALLVASHGLPEYEVRSAADGGTEVLLTLLRCVGALSRDDLSTRRGHAGPGLPTPDAQCPGSHRASFALLPHSRAWADVVPHARAFASPAGRRRRTLWSRRREWPRR